MRRTGENRELGSVVGVSVLAALGATILLGARGLARAARGDASVVATDGA